MDIVGSRTASCVVEQPRGEKFPRRRERGSGSFQGLVVTLCDPTPPHPPTITATLFIPFPTFERCLSFSHLFKHCMSHFHFQKLSPTVQQMIGFIIPPTLHIKLHEAGLREALALWKKDSPEYNPVLGERLRALRSFYIPVFMVVFGVFMMVAGVSTAILYELSQTSA